MRAEYLHEQYKEDIIQKRSNNSKNKRRKMLECWVINKKDKKKTYHSAMRKEVLKDVGLGYACMG